MTADRRWATFDCYGTLIDWNGGLRDALGRIFGQSEGTRMLDRYHAVEALVQAEDSSLGYREVMAEVLSRLAAEDGVDLPLQERDALGRSLPSWPVFPEVREALTAAQRREWRLAILSNTDRDFIDASIERIGVPFELAIVASEIGSYKPDRGHWDAFFDRTGADPSLHVHVGASLYHDIRPSAELGLRSIWINRLDEHADDVAPARELPDLSRLAETLDELVRRPG